MKKNYLIKVKSVKNLFLTISVISAAALVMSFGPMFFGPGLTTPEPFDIVTNTTFSPNGTATDPYEVAFPNLDFDTPLNFNVVPGQNNIVLGQRDGKVYWFPNDNGTNQKNLVIDFSNEVGVVWDGGFLGLSIHPQFGTGNGSDYFYIYYTSVSSTGDDTLNDEGWFECGLEGFHDNYLLLERFEVDPATLTFVPNTRVEMLKRRMYNTTHRGGGMEFGNDGFLYLSTGDQATYVNAQNISENLDGGVLRIDVDKDPTKSHAPRRTLSFPGAGEADEFSGVEYWIPNDNPFLSPTGDTFEEYYSLGHRNPHRMTNDKVTGTFYIGEVGENTHEEINVLAAGKNYGWPLYEAFAGPKTSCVTQLYNNMPHEEPLVEFQRSEASSIIGGYVYRGTDIPALEGKYICADYGPGNEIWQVDTSNGNKQLLGNFTPSAPVSFGQDQQGELYILSYGDGVKLYRLTSSIDLGAAPAKLSDTGAFTDLSNLTVASGYIPYEMIDPFWSDGAYKKRWMAIPNDGSHDSEAEQIQWSENGDWQFPIGTVIIKHFDYPIDDTNPSITRKIETRFSIKGTDGKFYFLTYKWRPDELDADLVDMEVGDNENISVDTGSGTRTVDWRYPSNTECITCHNPALGGTIGPRTRSLNEEYDYADKGGTIGNQLVTLSELGILNATITDSDTPGYLTHMALDDPNGTLEEKARTYLDNNCAYCHQPATGNRAGFDLRLFNTLAQTGMLTAGMNQPLPELGPNQKILIPGDAANSQIYHRVNNTETGVMMPPLAKNQIDTDGVQLLYDWIEQLQPAAEAPEAGNYRIVNRSTNETLQVPDGGMSNGANVAVGSYSGQSKQHFALEETAEGYYQLRALHSNKYIDVQYGNPDPNTNVWQYQGNGSSPQTWEILDAGDGTFNLVSRLSGYYLAQDAAGNVLVVENTLNDDIRWEFLPTNAPFTIGIDIEPTLVITSEDGTTDEFDVKLKSAPVDDVVLLVSPLGAIDEFVLSETELTFTSTNWDMPQTVTVTGVDDNDEDGVQYYDIELAVDGPRSDSAYAGFVATIGGYNEDNDGGGGAPPAPGVYRLINEDSGLSIEVLNAGTANGVNVEQGLYQGGSHEQFELVYQDNGLYSFVAQHSGRALDVEMGNPDAGANIWQYDNNATISQLWKIEDSGNGTYHLISELGGYYLGIAPDGNIQVEVDNGTDTFKWRFKSTESPGNAGLTINEDGVYTDEDGDTDSFTVVLNEAPIASVTVALTVTLGADEVSLSSEQLNFDQNNWNTPQTVTVTGENDDDQDGSQDFFIEAAVITPISDPNYDAGVGDTIIGINYDNDGGDNGAPAPGIYRLQNVENTQSIMPENGGLTRDTNIVTDIYDASSYQHFELVPAGNDLYSIKAIHDNLVLDIQGGNQNAGANVWMYTGNNNNAQLWQIVDAGNNTYHIISALPGGYYLTAEPNGNVSVNTDDDGDIFRWRFLPTGFAPNAVASANIFSGNEPLPVQFTGSASTDDKNDIVSYLWDFGNGDTSAEIDPLYTFESGGLYEVTLTITDGDDYSDTSDIIEIDVNASPISVVDSDVVSGNVPLSVNFNGDQSSDDTSIVSYEWNFGDGNTSNDINPSNIYNNAGVYEVSLTVTDGDGLSDISNTTITVNGAPNANIIANKNGGVAPVEVIFYGDSSTDDFGIVEYLWEFGDGTTSSDMNPTYIYTVPGTYEVILTVTDEGGLVDTDTITITVVEMNEAPVAIASSNVDGGVAPLEVIFTGDQSTDDVGVVSYSWNFGDDTTSTLNNPIHSYVEPGVYTAELTVTDAEGLEDSTTITITVLENEPPVAVVSSDVASGVAPLEVNFTGDQSTDDVGIASYNWNFGDDMTSTEANPVHTFTTEGIYEVTLTVTDAGGLEDTDVISITVTEGSNNMSPVAVIGADVTNGLAPLEVNFTGDQSTDDVSIVTYNWNFGDDSSSTEINPGHVFAAVGVYEVTLTVTDADGLQDSAVISITVTENLDNLPPIAVASADVLEGIAPLEVTFTAEDSTDDNEIISYLWDFNDGTTATDVNPVHVFEVIGTYDVVLTVSDEQGLESSATITINVLEDNIVLEQPSFEFVLAPNPSTEYVDIVMKDNFNLDEILGVMLHDSAGRLIRQYMVNEVLQDGRLRLSTYSYRNEVYVVTLMFRNDEPVSKRLIIQ